MLRRTGLKIKARLLGLIGNWKLAVGQIIDSEEENVSSDPKEENFR